MGDAVIAQTMTKERIGIIDLGSNSSRLIIYDILHNGAYQPIFEMKQNVRLAEHLNEEKQISDTGIARAVACIRLFRRAGELHGVDHWIPVTTAAIRQAKNRIEVLSAIEQSTGIHFRVLDGKEEGRYGYLGVINTLCVDNAVLCDIGGASTELVLVRDRQLVDVVSLPYGALNLTERFRNVPETEVGDRVKAFFEGQLGELPLLQGVRELPLIGLGGTARALAKLDVSSQRQELEHVHGYPVTTESVRNAFAKVSQLEVDKRRKIKGLSKSRADIFVAGLGIITALVDYTAATELIVSRNGLRQGVFYEYLLKDKPSPVLDSVLEDSLENFNKIFRVNKQVADTVTEASLELFDQLDPVHRLTAEDRQLLRVTAQIESCGCYVNTERWTRHSAYLALSSHLYGLRYHQFQDVASLLAGKGNQRLKKLLLLIRLAKLFTLQLGMAPKEVKCNVAKGRVLVGGVPDMAETVQVSADADLDEEFKKLFGLPLVYAD